ncbi:MAG: rod shape-determining protein RodA [Lentisphaerae bacterium]|nr:rod shape-determining protein RodA [Lentisphaerota bacterium]
MRRAEHAWRLLRGLSWPMFGITLLLSALGVLFVYSACYASVEGTMRALYRRQLLWAGVGLAAYLGFAAFDYRRLRRLTWWIYAGSLLLLVLVLLIGTEISGARRWLMVFGIGLQPSELAKLAVVLALARKLSRPGESLGGFGALAGVLALVLAPMILIIQQPDLGTAMVFLPAAFVMMFAAGVPLRSLLVLLAAGSCAVGVFLGSLFLPARLGVSEEGQARIISAVGLRPYHRDRIEAFFNPERDPLNAGWNKMQSEIAVGSGGVWGKGYLKGTQNILGFLPRKVAPTDFIYSVIAEETGFVGSTVVLVLFGGLLVLGARTACAARDKMGRLVCAGITATLFVHVFVNIAMTVGIMPITGLPLPLLSYGGTFMVVTMASLGIIQSVHIRSHMYPHGF